MQSEALGRAQETVLTLEARLTAAEARLETVRGELTHESAVAVAAREEAEEARRLLDEFQQVAELRDSSLLGGESGPDNGNSVHFASPGGPATSSPIPGYNRSPLGGSPHNDSATVELKSELDDERRMYRELEEEHEDLLALLAQQELEKNAIRDKLLEVAGNDAVSLARKLAERQCLTRFGTFIPEY